MKISRETLRDFRNDFRAQMIKLEKEYGIAISLGTIRFDSDQFRVQLTVNNLTKSGQKAINVTGPGAQFVGKKFTRMGKTYIVVDYIPTRRKYPLVFEQVGQSGKRYKGTVDLFYNNAI